MQQLEDGIITPRSDKGKLLGFTPDKFTGDSYLWKKGNYIWISNIESKVKSAGYLRSLFETIESVGYKVAVPTPMRRMEEILVKNGFEPMRDAEYGCEVWVKDNQD